MFESIVEERLPVSHRAPAPGDTPGCEILWTRCKSPARDMISPKMAAMTAYTSPSTWRHVAGAWLALGLFDATQTVLSMQAMGMRHAWWTLFFTTVASWGVWAACTPFALALLKRSQLPSKRAGPWLAHGAAWLAICLAWASWSALLEHAFNPFDYPHGPARFIVLLQDKLLGNLVGGVILYGAIVTLGVAFDSRQRLSQQRELLAHAQLSALRLQLEPHFIFNTLNSVTGLIREQRGDEAITVVAALGDLLRRVTDRSERQLVALADDIDFLSKYLEIQQLRFAERLRCRLDIPTSLLGAQVPDLTLQPLVENAIKHGIAKRAKGGEIHISASRTGNVLTLAVFNEGPALAASGREGVGLSNTRKRLRALFGDEQALELRDVNAGVLATITLPYRKQ